MPDEKKPNYWQQLQDPRWKRKRLEIMQRAKFSCEECGKSPEFKSLHIHHKYYSKDFLAWEYPSESLLCVCEFCHEIVAKSTEQFLNILKSGDNGFMLSYLADYIKMAQEQGHNLHWCIQQIKGPLFDELFKKEHEEYLKQKN